MKNPKQKLTAKTVLIGSALLLTATVFFGNTPSLSYWGLGLVGAAFFWMFGSVGKLFAGAAQGPAPGCAYIGPEGFVAAIGALGIGMLLMMIVILAGYQIKDIWLTQPLLPAIAQLAALVLGIAHGIKIGIWRTE